MEISAPSKESFMGASMEIPAPIKESFIGASRSMEPLIPRAGAEHVRIQPSMDASSCYPDAFMEISAPSKEAFMGASMEIPAPIKESFGASRSMEPLIPRACAGHVRIQPFMDVSCCYPEAFVEAPASDTEVFTKISASMESQKAAAVTSCKRHDASIFEKSAPMSEEGEELTVYSRKGRPIRRIERKERMFDRRRNRLFKKACELSVLCNAEVGAIVFSPSGKISEFASSSTSHIIRRYQSFQPQMPSNNVLLQDVERCKLEGNLMDKKLKYLQEFQRYVFENNNLTISEAKNSETMLKHALTKIRKRKSDLLEVEAQKIIEKGETLCKESNVLQQKLTQLLAAKECVSNASNEWRLDILQGTSCMCMLYLSNTRK